MSRQLRYLTSGLAVVTAAGILGACQTTAGRGQSTATTGQALSPHAAAQGAIQPTATRYSANEQANSDYVQALDALAHGDPRTGGTFANARAAISLFQQAADRDPKLAIAYVQIARAWQSQGYSNPDAPPASEIDAHSRAALKQALKIDPNLPDAHTMLAQIFYLTDYDWAGAEREYRWAVAHDPNGAPPHAGLANFLATTGRFEEAMQHAVTAENIRHSPGDAFTRARIYYDMRNYDAAVEHCRRALAMQENQAMRFFLGLMLMAQGHRDEAVTELENASNKGDNAGAGLGRAYGYAMAGRRDDALRVVADVQRTHTDDQIPPYRLAAVYLALGDKDQAMAYLNRDRETHGNWTVQVKVDPVMDPLRSDPRFHALIQQLKFPG